MIEVGYRRGWCVYSAGTCGFRSYLEHLPDFLLGQVDVEFVEQLVNLADAQGAVAVFVSLRERLLQPRDAAVKVCPSHKLKVDTKTRGDRARVSNALVSRTTPEVPPSVL